EEGPDDLGDVVGGNQDRGAVVGGVEPDGNRQLLHVARAYPAHRPGQAHGVGERQLGVDGDPWRQGAGPGRELLGAGEAGQTAHHVDDELPLPLVAGEVAYAGDRAPPPVRQFLGVAGTDPGQGLEAVGDGAPGGQIETGLQVPHREVHTDLVTTQTVDDVLETGHVDHRVVVHLLTDEILDGQGEEGRPIDPVRAAGEEGVDPGLPLATRVIDQEVAGH